MNEKFIDFIIWASLAFMGMLAVRLLLEELLDHLDDIIIKTKKNKKRVKKRYNKKKYNQLLKQEWFPIYSFNDYATARQTHTQIIMTMPQLTFDRWLIFYNNKPENWIIQKNECKQFCDIPYYVKKISKHKTIYLPIFWTDYKEINKYRDWVETQYEFGKSKNFENDRDYNMQVLTSYIQEDINERKKQIEKEYQQAKENIIKLSDGTITTITEK